MLSDILVFKANAKIIVLLDRHDLMTSSNFHSCWIFA